MRMLRLIFLLLMESGPGLPLRPLILQLPGLHTFTKHKVDSYSYDAFQVGFQTKVREDFTITEKAPSRAFSWLKEPLSHVRHYVLRLYSKQAPKHGK